MIAMIAGVLLVPMLDQALKLVALRKLQVTRGQIRLARTGLMTMWTLWLVAAIGLTLLTGRSPAYGWLAGVLLGGSLSHALETSLRGCIIDYVRLGYWPAFNLADVAITAGAIGILVQLTIEAWS